MNLLHLVAAVFTFAGVTSLSMYLGRMAERRLYARAVRRSFENGRSRSRSFFSGASVQGLLLGTILPLGRLAVPQEAEDLAAIRGLISQAGYRAQPFCPVQAYYGLRVLLALTAGGLYCSFLLFSGGWSARSLVKLFLPLAAGYYLPAVILRWQAAKRSKKIWKELPDVLDLLKICIDAGLSLDSALFRVSRDLKDIAPVLSRELAQYFFEIQSGLSRKEVLAKLAARNQVNALSGVVQVLLQSTRLGTDISQALEVYAASLRTERMQAAEEKGAKVATKLTFPLILLILPALLLVILGPAIINMLEKLGQLF